VSVDAPEKRYYMACLDLEGRDVLVVGGGAVALEKVDGLLASGARITVVAPAIRAELRTLPLACVERPFRPSDLDGRHLVIAATSDDAVNDAVFHECERRRLFCNTVDDPDRCSVILPAVHREGPIAIAVSTGGASPALAKRIRDEAAALVGPHHAELARQLRARRPWAKQALSTYAERKEHFERLVEQALR
jgi:precorrin-2 dehydrogenase/sirohydrochlorin ferrochelatase